MIGIVRHRNAPFEADTGYGQILQSAFDEACHLIPAAVGCDEVWVLLIEVQQATLPSGEPEEVSEKTPDEMSKGELRSVAEEKGVYEKGMTKAQLLEVLAGVPEEVEEEEEETFEGFDDE